jgi:hypothetical protein
MVARRDKEIEVREVLDVIGRWLGAMFPRPEPDVVPIPVPVDPRHRR